MLSYMKFGSVVYEERLFKEKVYSWTEVGWLKTDHDSLPGAFGSGELKKK